MRVEILVDADLLCYKTANAIQSTCYIVAFATGKYKDVGNEYTMKELKDKLGSRKYSLIKYYNTKPVEEMYDIIEDIITKINVDVLDQFNYPDLVWKFFLSPPKCFRHDIYPEYKANRPPPAANVGLTKKYLIEKYKAKVVYGVEADDALGVTQSQIAHSPEHTSVICSIDKDLLQICGHHYNIDNRVFTEVKESQGSVLHLEQYETASGKKASKLVATSDCLLYAQMLMGDKTDNIPGLPRTGPATAYKLLKKATTVEAMQEVVRREYQRVYKDEWKDRLQLVTDLVYIRTKKGDRYDWN